MKKKMCEKKRVQWRLEWATAHFLFVLSHDIVDCIVTQGAQQAHMNRKDKATIWPGTATIRTRRSHPACPTWSSARGMGFCIVTQVLCRNRGVARMS